MRLEYTVSRKVAIRRELVAQSSTGRPSDGIYRFFRLISSSLDAAVKERAISLPNTYTIILGTTIQSLLDTFSPPPNSNYQIRNVPVRQDPENEQILQGMFVQFPVMLVRAVRRTESKRT